MKKGKLRYYFPMTKLFIFLFALLSFICTLLFWNIANSMVENYRVEEFRAFYWLSPSYAGIQFGNILLMWGGILSVIVGACYPLLSKAEFLFNLKILMRMFTNILARNLIYTCTSLFSVFVTELFLSGFRLTNFSLSIFVHSIQMFTGVYVHFLFWIIVGLGLSLTFKRKTLGALIGAIIQLSEVFIIFPFYPTMEKYLPTAISRLLIVDQFPFWDPNTWAGSIPVTALASTPLTVNEKYQLIKLNNLWILTFLLIYLCIVYLLPVFRLFKHYKITNPGSAEKLSS
jgi:hypothetical protein